MPQRGVWKVSKLLMVLGLWSLPVLGQPQGTPATADKPAPAGDNASHAVDSGVDSGNAVKLPQPGPCAGPLIGSRTAVTTEAGPPRR